MMWTGFRDSHTTPDRLLLVRAELLLRDLVGQDRPNKGTTRSNWFSDLKAERKEKSCEVGQTFWIATLSESPPSKL